MNGHIAGKVEEVALLVAMLHENDQVGFALVISALEELSALISQEPELARLKDAVDHVIASKDLAGPAFFKLCNDFSNAAERYSRDPQNARFPNEPDQSAPVSSGPSDLSADYDPDLISDFIQEHTIKLEDFESVVLGVASGTSTKDPREVDRFSKSYLHNIKGDAGTVGLEGIQRVTHHLEDLLAAHGTKALAEVLLLFKEWVTACMKSFAANQQPEETSSEFKARIDNLLPKHQTVDPTNTTDGVGEAVKKEESASSNSQAVQSETYTLTGDSEIIGEFVAEAEDHFQTVEGILLERDEGFGNEEINSIFRAIHSIKGASSYFNLLEVTRCSHLLENILDRARKDQIKFDTALKSLVLTYIDLQRKQLERAKEAITGNCILTYLPEAARFLEALEEFAEKVNIPAGKTVRRVPEKQAAGEEAPLHGGEPAGASDMNREEQTEQDRTAAARDGGGEKLDLKTFVKVDLNRLDALIEWIGEMVISSSMLVRSCRTHLGKNQSVMNNTHQLEQICREIQGLGMSMRLVPIKGLLQKMSRLVWDTSRKIGKEINFKTEGEDTELDRTVIDRLADPLMHMIRNSLDHGIEPPDERQKAGKPRGGLIMVRAFHHGGNIHIEVSDDGRGLNPEKLFKKAVEKGLVSEGQKMSDEDIYLLIFAPGFSTAEKVTDISGRGVGMDVVRRNIESMRGRVSIKSQVGKGSVFTIQLPLTLAIVDGIETYVGTERFIIPTHSVVEFVKPKASQLSTTNEAVETLHFRDSFIPIFHLSSLYGVETKYETTMDAILAVVESGNDMVAVVLDGVIGNYSTVIKPLGGTFEHVKGLAGGAIMPDGNIGLILDVPTLIQLARTTKSQNHAMTKLSLSSDFNPERKCFEIRAS